MITIEKNTSFLLKYTVIVLIVEKTQKCMCSSYCIFKTSRFPLIRIRDWDPPFIDNLNSPVSIATVLLVGVC